MKLLTIGLLTLTTSLYAGGIKDLIKEQSHCKGGLKIHKNLVAIKDDHARISVYDLINGNQTSYALTKGYLHDFALSGDDIYLLTRNEIFKNNEKIQLDPSYGWPNQIYLLDGKIFVSRDGGMLEVVNDTMIPLSGNIHSITHDASRIYVLADTSGVINGAIHNSIFVLDRATYKVLHETKVYSNPTGHIELKGEKLFIGKTAIWELDLKTVLKKDFISTYRSVFNPQPSPTGFPFRDDENLYYCDDSTKELKLVKRSSIER